MSGRSSLDHMAIACAAYGPIILAPEIPFLPISFPNCLIAWVDSFLLVAAMSCIRRFYVIPLPEVPTSITELMKATQADLPCPQDRLKSAPHSALRIEEPRNSV